MTGPRPGRSSLRLLAVVVLAILVVSAGSILVQRSGGARQGASQGGATSAALGNSAQCIPVAANPKPVKSQLPSVTFGAVTKFALPTPGRSSNAIAAAPDGSVWFGEQALPGLGHLFPNGTLVEYQWPFDDSGSGNLCSSRTSIWGIALWDGKVWASDVAGNQLVGLDPANDSLTRVSVPTKGAYPYTMTVGPDGQSLWFTELFASKIGRLFPNQTIKEYTVGNGQATPTQVTFANDTLGYFVNVGSGLNSLPPAAFSFNPQAVSSSQALVGGNQTLYSPNSLSLGDGGLWLTQHAASSVVFYNFTGRTWTTYPTSTVSYIDTTLPYWVQTNGTQLWFNEHYANRMADLDTKTGTITEYSLADPPISNSSQIENALTFALGGNRVWFTEWTANYVGFVNPAIGPGFDVNSQRSVPVNLPLGGKTTFDVGVEGNSSQRLSVQFSTSQTFTSVPQNLTIISSPSALSGINGPQQLVITVVAENGLKPGNYTLLVSLDGGLAIESVYVPLEIG